MITNNPFSALAEIIPAIAMQGFVIAMAALTLIGVLVDILHKKNVKYFFENAKIRENDSRIFEFFEISKILKLLLIFKENFETKSKN